MPRIFIATCLAFLLAPTSGAVAQQWGTIKGRILFDGDAPEPQEIPAGQVTDAVCKTHSPIPDEKVVINAETGAFANVVIYLYTRRGQTVDVHPDFAKPEEAEPGEVGK